MTIDWALLLIVAAAGWLGHVTWQQLGGKLNWWVVPYRERCRRSLATNPSVPDPYRPRCHNWVWRIRWSALAPLSKVCRSCRAADAKRMSRRLGT